jgi:hypothetical protein
MKKNKNKVAETRGPSGWRWKINVCATLEKRINAITDANEKVTPIGRG